MLPGGAPESRWRGLTPASVGPFGMTRRPGGRVAKARDSGVGGTPMGLDRSGRGRGPGSMATRSGTPAFTMFRGAGHQDAGTPTG